LNLTLLASAFGSTSFSNSSTGLTFLTFFFYSVVSSTCLSFFASSSSLLNSSVRLATTFSSFFFYFYSLFFKELPSSIKGSISGNLSMGVVFFELLVILLMSGVVVYYV